MRAVVKARLMTVLYLTMAALYLLMVIYGCQSSSDSSNSSGQDQDNNDQNISALEDYLKQGIRARISGANFNGEADSPVVLADASATNGLDITNTQEAGVDEADIVEFDGERLFVVKNREENGRFPTIVEAFLLNGETAQANKLGNLKILPGSGVDLEYLVQGAYLWKTQQHSRLAIFESPDVLNHLTVIGIPFNGNFTNTVLTFVDADDPADMLIEQRWDIDGELISSRRVQNRLHFVTRYYPDVMRLGINSAPQTEAERIRNGQVIEKLTVADMLPKYQDKDGVSHPLVSPENCVVPAESKQSDYYDATLVVVSTIDLDNPASITSTCLAISASAIYASKEAIYLIGDFDFYRASNYETVFYKYALNGMIAEYRGSGAVPGSIPCNPISYCFGEQNGVLRVLYSSLPLWGATYHLELLKEADDGSKKLESIASLPNEVRPETIGKPGEQVYAMRSYGDYVYIVTFERIDPLYVINLRNPMDPFIAGELEVTGFSEYLHPIGDGLLLGVGSDALFDSQSSIVFQQKVKIELFDISDPADPLSIGGDIIGKRGSWTPVTSDPHTFASARLDDDAVLAAIPVSVHNRLPLGGDQNDPNQYYDWDHSALYIYKIDLDNAAQSQLTLLGRVTAEQFGEEVLSNFYANLAYDRAVFLDQSVFYLHNDTIHSMLFDELD
jgi:hypothetical protein